MTNYCLTIRAPDDENIEQVYRILEKETYMHGYWDSFVPPNVIEFKVISSSIRIEGIKSEIQSIYSEKNECNFSSKPLNENTYNILQEFFLNG